MAGPHISYTILLYCRVTFDAAVSIFNWMLSYNPINITILTITPSSLRKIIYHYMNSKLSPIWKALRASWVLLGKKKQQSKNRKTKTAKRVTSCSPTHYFCRIHLIFYVFYCFNQPNCNYPCTGFPPLS